MYEKDKKSADFFETLRDGIIERHFSSMSLGINSGLLGLEFLSVFLPSFFPIFCSKNASNE